ncbi:MAG: chemotaxis protein CheC [Candidatus Omnitrophica bacterium]|nr:chemotaxis protein CheC [Candidatus Omnitrophota bacterium]
MDKNSATNRAIQLIARLSIDKASQVFSKVLKTGARIELVDVTLSDIVEVTERVNKESREIVGAFVDLTGEIPFKFLLFVDVNDSLTLCDLMLRKEMGTMKEFDIYASSAVQEIANILACAIANVFSTDFQMPLRPSPPTVVRDYSGTIFEEYIVETAMESNEILMIESRFCVIKHSLSCDMFIMPCSGGEKLLQHITKKL